MVLYKPLLKFVCESLLKSIIKKSLLKIIIMMLQESLLKIIIKISLL